MGLGLGGSLSLSMFDFILRWFGKGKPQEDTSSQGEDTSFFGSNSLFANEEGDEATSTSIEEAERADAAELCGQADNTLRMQIAELTARLARTKKALEKAEEENEELEDKLKREKREAEKAKEAEEQVSALEKQLSSLKETLDEKTDQANCRGEALTFVREVLTAQVTSERSELEQKVEEMVALIHSDECRAYITLTNEGERDLSMWQSECAKSWIQGKVKVAFIGEFSAGKTSIVNRLLQDGDSP